MDGDICPPWWPNLLWWRIHHPPKGDGPVWDERQMKVVDEVLASLSVFVLSGSLSEASAPKVRQIAGEDLKASVGRLVSAIR
jgi:hypothetical protein